MSGNVLINIVEGGGAAVSVPGAGVQVVIGCSSAGSVNQVVATKSPSALLSAFGYGPLTEAAALACLAGGTVLAIKATTNATGTATDPVTVGTGTSVITTTLDGTTGAFDDYFVSFKVVKGATIGVAGALFQISLDAGRHYGPTLALGTAATYAIPNTGITLNFADGTLVTGDVTTFSTTAPAWNDAGIQAALNALKASTYAGSGWGSTHIVGVAAGSDASTIETYLDNLATNYLFTRAFLSARDAHAPTAWGGAGETESAWMDAIGTDFSAVSAKRICVSAGFYNMPTAYPNPAAGAPSYRRSLAWAAAARQVTVPPQRHIGRVSDGALSNIVVNPTSDPMDGFIYHDERNNPGLDYLFADLGTNRFMCATTRIPNLPGYYITNPLLASPLGSDFSLMPYGSVMDVACSIVHQVGQEEIDADVRLNPNGTLYINEALSIQNTILGVINADMTAQRMISSATVAVDQTANVGSTHNVPIAVTLVARGYVLSETVTIGFSNPNAAQAA